MFSQSKAKDPTVAISRNSPVPKRTKSCDGTIFSMKPMENILFVHYDEPVVVDFKTDKSKFRGFPKVITQLINAPYIPLFGIEDEIQKLISKEDEYKTAFAKLYSNSVKFLQKKGLEKNSNSLILRPCPTRKFCQICRCNYEDYEIHTKEEKHLSKINQTGANNLIQDQIVWLENVEKEKTSNAVYIDLLKASEVLRDAKKKVKAIVATRFTRKKEEQID